MDEENEKLCNVIPELCKLVADQHVEKAHALIKSLDSYNMPPATSMH